MNRSELAIAYPDNEWRRKLVDLLSLVSVLRECIIKNSYRPSEELNASILLSETGTKVSTQLTIQEKVNAKDAHVLALLGLVHVDPLIDIVRIDIERLELAISSEMKSGALRYPLIFGRELYNRAVELFPEERAYLNHEDTLKLMEDREQGVFQVGHYLIGPFGIRRRSFLRRMGPTTAIPIQHCSDSACNLVHRVQLTTSIEAGVNRSRPALSKILDQISPEPSEWNGFVSDITENDFNEYSIEGSATLCYLIGDGFSDAELRDLVIHAASTTEGKLQKAATELGLVGQAKAFVEALGRAQLLQLLFMLDDASLATLVDSAVREEVLTVPLDEVRRPQVNARTQSGAWRIRSQLSRLGVRSISSDSDLPLLRLSALGRALFNNDSTDDMDELAWILRGIVGDTPKEQLEEFLRTSEPRLVIATLVLARKSNASKVCDELGIPLDQNDSALRDAILWKLGFPLPRSRDIRDEYWELHQSLESLAKTASVDLSTTAEGLRAASSNYFVSLERFLFDSLCFATWALLADHYSSASPFVFFESDAREFTINTLNGSISTEEDRNPISSEPVLSAVVEGFTRLSKLLSSIRGTEADYARDPSGYPKFAPKTDLQKFPFLHVHPFLDLTPESQVNLLSTLGGIASDLNNSGIMSARNGLLHAKQRIPTVGELEEALQKSRVALDRLEGIGCVRSTFAISSSLMNAWGGATTTLVSNGRAISFSSPSAYEWAKLPAMATPHYLMQGAVFAAPNEMLRFSEGFNSEFQDYWRGYPHRPEPGNRVVSSQSETMAISIDSGSLSASRAG